MFLTLVLSYHLGGHHLRLRIHSHDSLRAMAVFPAVSIPKPQLLPWIVIIIIDNGCFFHTFQSHFTALKSSCISQCIAACVREVFAILQYLSFRCIQDLYLLLHCICICLGIQDANCGSKFKPLPFTPFPPPCSRRGPPILLLCKNTAQKYYNGT